MRVPLHDVHAALGARFVEFAGFEMPVQFASILAEHQAVREAAGLFDVSHMSNLWVEGAGAAELLAKTMGADIRRLKDGRAQYTVALKEDGTIIDDLIVYRFGPERFHVVPNAGMNATMTEWLRKHAQGKATVKDVSREMCILALQGPKAREILDAAYAGIGVVKRFGAVEWETSQGSGFVSGTGYTGEDGVELIIPNAAAKGVWDELLKTGASMGLLPCGLGARDTLRLEKGFCLASHEFKGGRTPLEARLDWTIHWDHDFIGRDALGRQKTNGSYELLTGLLAEDPGIPREGCEVRMDGKRAGAVTSGTMSPVLRKGIALAYLRPEFAQEGKKVAIQVRDKAVRAVVKKPPFV